MIFLSELGIIAHINHPNAAKLHGFGVDGGLHLVLEFSPHAWPSDCPSRCHIYTCHHLVEKLGFT